jgi:hypothetical protein
VRSAKARLKRARKLLKTEKKAAKQARKKLDAAAMTPVRAANPAAVAKPIAAPKRVAVPKPASVRKRAPAPKAARRASRRAPKSPAAKPPETMRTASQVAKTVIERLHRPPPVLPTPVITADPAPPADAAAPEA